MAVDFIKIREHYEHTPDVSHGPAHINAVLHHARNIGKNYADIEPEDIEAAALLHDIGREGDYLNGTDDHHVRGVSLAKPYLEHLPAHRRDSITDAILNHRSSGTPETTLGRIIADSDRLDSVHRNPQRSFDYYRSKGMAPDSALRAGYWNLRHRKLSTLGSRAKNFHTEEGRQIYMGQVAQLEAGTRTFKDYISMIPEVDQDMEFKKEAAIASVGAYHFSHKGFKPGNMLDKPVAEQVKVLVKDEKSMQTLKQRHTTEQLMHDEANKKLGLKKQLKHPLYFKLGDKPDEAWKDSVRYTVAPEAMAKSTFTKGDSLHKFRLATKNDANVLTMFNKELLTHKEVDKLPEDKLVTDKPGDYIEGQLWAPYKIEERTIKLASVTDFLARIKSFLNKSKKEKVEDMKEETTSSTKSVSYGLSKKADLFGYGFNDNQAEERQAEENKAISKTDAFYMLLNDELSKEAAPAGTVSSQPMGEAADPVTTDFVPGADVGQAADALHARVKLFQQKHASQKYASAPREVVTRNFREDYRLPSSDPTDRAKLENYKAVNQGLLDKFHWAPSIKRHLEKEIRFADGQTGVMQRQEDAMMRQQELAVKQQEVMLQGQQIGLKAQEAGIGHQNKLVDATVKQMEGQAHRDTKEGDALLTSANKGVALPPSSRPPMGQPSVPGATVGGQPVQSGAAGDPNAQGNDPQAQQGQQAQPVSGNEQQGQQAQQGQQQVDPKAKKQKVASAGAAVDGAINGAGKLLKNVTRRVSVFGNNLGGRHTELEKMYRDLGDHTARAEVLPNGSFHQQVNEAAGKALQDKITKTKLDVRAARTNAALGVAGGTALYHEYAEPKYASANDGYTLSINTDRGFAADVIHAAKTLNNGYDGEAKRKLLASAALAGAAAGVAAYGYQRLDPLLHAPAEHYAMGKAIGEMLPFIGTLGGSYYAARNRNNNAKRIAGSAVALTSGLVLGKQFGESGIVPGTTNQMAIDALPFAGGVYTAAGAFAYGSHKAQHIADSETIRNAMHSNAPIEEVTEIVNRIREQKNLDTHYPILRHALIPKPARKLINARYGAPAGKLSGDDMAYYFQSQVDTEYKKLIKSYEANNGHPTQEASTELMAIAHDTVSRRLM